VFAVFATMQSAVCHGWSILHPLTLGSKSDTKTKKTGIRKTTATKSNPSVLDKMGSAVGLKKTTSTK
jgi:hypothetical protein